MANEFIARKGIISLDSIQVSGSITATGGITVSGSISSASFATSAATASSADNFFVRQNLTASSALFTGSITAQTLVVQTVTSSIVYSSGSNIFGNQLTNVQQMTGSLRVTGSGFVAGDFTSSGTGIFGGFTNSANTGLVVNTRLTDAGSIRVRFAAASTVQDSYISDFYSNETSYINFNRNNSTGNSYIAFGTGLNNTPTERVRITASGSIGIATTSPTSFLQIGTYASAGKYIDSATLSNAPSNYLITLTPPSTTNYYGGGIGWSEGTCVASAINAYDDGAGGALGLSISTGNNTTLTERIRITSAGYVGIGTCSPPVGLSVQGSTADSVTLQLKQNAVGGRDFRITSRDDGSLRFNDDTAGSERMRINCGGFVKMSNTGTYIDSAANYYEMRSSLNNPVLFVWASNASYADDILSVRAERNTTNNTFKAIRYYNQGAAADRFYITDGGGGYFACSVGIRTTSTSTEGNLFLGANSTEEGGQLVLQKATNYSCATHLDNYANQFRVLSGTDTGTTAVHMMIDHTTRNACFYGALYVPETYIQGPTISYAAQLNPAGPAYTQDLQLVICHSNWGGNDDTGTVYVEYTARAYAVSQTTAAYGTMTYRLNNGGTQIGSFGTGGVTTSCVTITGDVGTSRVLKINFAVSQNVDRITVFARTTNPFVTSVTGILV